MSASQDTSIMERGAPDHYVTLAEHPRAKRSISRAKALGGVAGFVLGLWIASRAGLPAWDAGVRALAGGIAGYVLIWLAAVQIWRQLAVAEVRAAEHEADRVRLAAAHQIEEIRRKQAEARS